MSIVLAVAFLALGLFLSVVLPILIPNASFVLHYAPPAVLLGAAAALIRSAARSRPAGLVITAAAPLWILLVIASTLYLPALQPFKPVKRMCGVILEQAGPGDEAGYYRADTPSMAFYLRSRIFEEFDAAAMERRLRGNRRVFCIMNRGDFRHFTEERRVALFVLDRSPRLITQLGPLLDPDGRRQNDLILASNRPPEGVPKAP